MNPDVDGVPKAFKCSIRNIVIIKQNTAQKKGNLRESCSVYARRVLYSMQPHYAIKYEASQKTVPITLTQERGSMGVKTGIKKQILYSYALRQYFNMLHLCGQSPYQDPNLYSTPDPVQPV